jgi:type III secretion system YscQ/HrcQ family protein
LSTEAIDQGPASSSEAEPLSDLPRVGRLQSQLDAALAREAPRAGLSELLSWLTGPIGLRLGFGRPEVAWRGAGLKRPGVIAQLAWPRLGTRVGLGIENPLAHALVDRMLGFERQAGEEHLQVTPVEWGLATFALARTLSRLAEGPGPLGDWDLILDRVGPEPFSVDGLGPVATVRWPVSVDGVEGSVRLWASQSLLAQWLLARPPVPPEVDPSALSGALGELAGDWRAEVGTIRMPRGLGRLRVGRVLPIDGSPLLGTVESPDGPVTLTLRDATTRYTLAAEPEPQSGGARLLARPPIRREPLPREVPSLSQPTETAPVASAGEVPATLTVEIGRVSLPLARLADLRPGDVIELDRDPSEPVELTSGGRLVARGELVQVEDQLGVRVTTVFL